MDIVVVSGFSLPLNKEIITTTLTSQCKTWDFYFDSGDHDMNYDFRYYGDSVRPVKQ